MNKEECMLALEQMILELPQYRKTTNELCNRYISGYVREAYEQKQIYIEGNYKSSRDYCWDVYDTVPVEIIESILDNFKEQDDIEQENQQLKEQLKQRDEVIAEAMRYIKKNTKYYDREYSKIYGELCDMAGAGDTRLHVVIGDEELLEILQKYKGDNNG
ncbi:MAG: hypothetical protein HFI36_02730 [Bacilli bacterium]|jgi:hypothetical protein|nr:hypothetical protein [Bacilli bacterium]